MNSIAIFVRCIGTIGTIGIKGHQSRLVVACSGIAALLLLTGCAVSPGQGGETHYRCERNVEFSVRFADDSAVLNGTRGHEVLYRDAGGQGAQQSVYSNPLVRAEFGLGASGKEALLRYPMLPLVLRCVRD
jgi:hypothetical protein